MPTKKKRHRPSVKVKAHTKTVKKGGKRKTIRVCEYCRFKSGEGWKRHDTDKARKEKAVYDRNYRPKGYIERIHKSDLYDKKAYRDSSLSRRENTQLRKSRGSFKNMDTWHIG